MTSLADILWSLVRWSLPVTVAGLMLVGALGPPRIGEEVRRRVEARLAREFPTLGVRVQSAALVEGQGIVVRGIALVDPTLPEEHRQLVWVDEATLACGGTLAEVLSGAPPISGIRLQRPVVRAFCNPDGRWSVAGIMGRRPSRAGIPISIDDATLFVEDARLRARATLRRICIEIVPPAAGGADAAAVVRGTVGGDLFDRAGFEGTLVPATGAFALSGSVASLEVSPPLLGVLPMAADMRAWAGGLRGRIDLRWRTEGLVDALAEARFDVEGRLESGRFENPALPFTLGDVRGSFRADRAGLHCEGVEAHSGSTLLRGEGRLGGWDSAADFDLAVEAERLLVGRDWEALLPRDVATHWSRLLPAGEVDLTARLVRRSGVVEPDISVRCRNVSLTHYRFPYRLDRTVGTVTFKGRTLALHLTGQAGGRPVQVDGSIATAPQGSRGFVEVRGDRLRIDDALLAAMPARSADIVRALRGAGTFGFVFRHERSPELQGGHANSLGIRLEDCTLSYVGFPYPLSGVSGIIRMDRGRWTIHDVVGSNDTGVVRCSGALEPKGDSDGELTLRLVGHDVVLERELRDALPSGMRRIWDDVDPRGNAEFTATVRHHVRQRRTDVELEAAPVGDTVSIEPAWFPYRLERLRGSLAWRDGRLSFKDVRGVHARTTVTTRGGCQFTPDGGWRVSFEQLSADRFRVDHDVLQALPEGLRDAVSGVGLRGLLSLDGSLDIRSTGPVPVSRTDGRTEFVAGPPAASWDLLLDMEQASIDAGLALEHVHGGVRLRGQSDGRTWWTHGDAAIDSAIWRGIQVTNLQGPLAIDPGGVRFGAAAASGRDSGGTRRLSARVAGGTLLADGSVAAADPGGFSVTASLGDADLERVTADATGSPARHRGRLFAGVDVTGSRAGAHSLAGRGQVRLRDADIYELSVVMALLKILRVKPPDRTAFGSSIVDFRIEGPRAYLDNIELSGDAISLVGAGEIDFDSNINLTFRSIMGDSQAQLPAMKRLLGGASGQFLLVHVGGTLAEPVPTTEAFPTLAAALQRLQAQRRGDGPRLAGRRDPP